MSSSNVIERLVDAPVGSALAEAMSQRAEILRLSNASHDAVIIPKEPGGFPHDVRAALAERIARLNNHKGLAEHYRECLLRAGSNDQLLSIADPARELSLDNCLSAAVRFTDLVTQRPRVATKADIQSLKSAGLSDPDIVRLTELIAFVNYQLRVVFGFELVGRM